MDRVGRYQLLEKLGEGGMGVVYKAHDPLLERVVAIKLIGSRLDETPQLRQRFFAEARAAGQLSHRNLVTIFDLGEEHGHPFFAMEYLEGRDLRRRLLSPEPMSLARKLDVIGQVGEGLAYAHANGVTHRDIKPANIFITSNGTVKLLDFGLARLPGSELTRSRALIGTVSYMAPEQIRGEAADARTDLFSLGVVLYELLSGRSAFEADSFASTLHRILQEAPEPLARLDPTLPPELIAIVDRAIAKAREERYQRVDDLLVDLASFRATIRVASGSEAFSDSREVTRLLVVPPSPGPAATPPMPVGTATATPVPSRTPAPSDTGVPNRAPASSSQAAAGAAPPDGYVSAARLRWIAGTFSLAFVLAAASWQAHVRWHAPVPTREPAPSGQVQAAGGGAGAPSPPVEASGAGAGAAADSRQETRVPDAAAPGTAPTTGQAAPRSPGGSRGRPPSSSGGTAVAASGRSSPASPTALPPASQGLAPRELAEGRIRERDRAAAQSAQSALGEAARARGRAESADAAGLAAGAFAAAEAAEQEGRAQLDAEAFGPAAQAFARARQLYEEAEQAARAEQARRELVRRIDEQSRRAQQERVIPALPEPPAPSSAEARAAAARAITELLGRYAGALESREMARLKRIWPQLGGAQERAIAEDFRNARAISVSLSEPRIEIAGDQANVVCRRSYRLETLDGQRLETDTRTVLTLRRAGEGWVIESVGHEARR